MKFDKNIYHQVALCCLVLLSFPILSQTEEIEVEGVVGEYIYNINSDISFVKAKEKAIEIAKKNALLKAGVKELISTTEVLRKSSYGASDIDQIYNSFTSSEIKGELLSYELVNKPKPKEISEETYKTTVVIDATIIKYETKSDPEFSFDIKGLKNTYIENEGFEFSISATKTGYLNVFIVERGSKEVSKIFPNDYEKQFALEKGRIRSFPINRSIEYALTVDQKYEKNDLFFVLTKENIEYAGKENMRDMIKWIYSIAPDKRCLQYHTVLVSKKNR
jgi:hypothetical protein